VSVAAQVDRVSGDRWGAEDGFAEIEFAGDFAFRLAGIDDLDQALFAKRKETERGNVKAF